MEMALLQEPPNHGLVQGKGRLSLPTELTAGPVRRVHMRTLQQQHISLLKTGPTRMTNLCPV